MLSKRLQPVLETYVANADEVISQCSLYDLMHGTITLHDLTLKSATLQDLYGSYLPACIEVVAGRVDRLQVVVPWISLHSSPASVEVQELSLECCLHCPVGAANCQDLEEIRCWLQQAERLASAGEQFEELCKAGARRPSLLDHVLRGLNVEVKRLRFELRRPEAASPAVVGDISRLQYRPVTQDWQPLQNLLAFPLELQEQQEVKFFACLDIDSITLETPCAGCTAVLALLRLKMLSKVPAQPPLHLPFACTIHKTIEMGSCTIAGSEGPTATLLAAVNDIYSSFSMVDQNGLLLQRYLPVAELDTVKRKDRHSIKSLQSENHKAVERLVHATHTRATAKHSCASLTLADPPSYESVQPQGSYASSDGSFQDALSDDEDIDHSSLEVSMKSSVSMENVGPPKKAPQATVERKTVTLKILEMKVWVPEGELVLRLDSPSLETDAAQPMREVAQRCCARLLNIPLSDQPLPPFGNILTKLWVQAADVQFHIKKSEGGARACQGPKKQMSLAAFGPRSSKARRLGSKSKSLGGPPGSARHHDLPHENLVLTLARQRQPPLQLTRHGPGGPVPHGELQAEPMELLVVGLQLQIGPGLDALRAWWARLRPELPQLPDPPAEQVPALCMKVQLLQTTLTLDPTDANGMTRDGAWPLQVALPLLEARSVCSTLDLPCVVHTLLSPTEDFEARSWWAPVQLRSSERPRGSSGRESAESAYRSSRTWESQQSTQSGAQADLLALQGVVQWQEQEIKRHERLNARHEQVIARHEQVIEELRSQVSKAHPARRWYFRLCSCRRH